MSAGVKIACVGDVMCGDSFYYMGHGVASSLKRFKENFLTKKMVEFLCSHDLVIGNIECVLSSLGRKDYLLHSLHMRGNPQDTHYLRQWGFNVANVANNHIFEHGRNAAIDTVKNLQNAGIHVVGAGKNGMFQPGAQISEITINQEKLVILGLCLCKERKAFYGGTYVHEALEIIRRLVCDGKRVIVAPHWGVEWMDRPESKQLQLGHALIEAGASLVVGHHPHVVQGIEQVNHGLVAYSLGNFIFNSFRADTRWSLILSVEINEGYIERWCATPIVADEDHRPHFARQQEKEKLGKEIQRRCALLNQYRNNKERWNQYQLEYRMQVRRSRRQLWWTLCRNMWKMRPIFWPQLLFRPIQRRLGIWQKLRG